MVSDSEGTPFIDEAARLGRRLAGAALRHDGRATWLADGYARVGGVWYRSVGTLGASLGSGTAGVAMFLARLCIVTGDRETGQVAVEAVRHSLDRCEREDLGVRLGWYEGALGVAWAGTDVGRRLERPELWERGVGLARSTVDALREDRNAPAEAGLLYGASGITAGLFALAEALEERAFAEAGRDGARALCQALMSEEQLAVPSPGCGLARGHSGVALALCSSLVAGPDDADARAAIARAFANERAWFEAGAGWWSAPVHDWMAQHEHPGDLTRSWCSGAAGIGIARVAAYAATSDLMYLAEAGAAIEVLRGGSGGGAPFDGSVCHGACGQIELLLVAAALLGEPAHLSAARTVGTALVERARRRAGYGSGYGPGTQDPSLLYGLGGIGLTLLRLYDPASAASPALPPFAQPERPVSSS